MLSGEEIVEAAIKTYIGRSQNHAERRKKGITVKIDTDLHAEVSQYLKDHNMTMAEFVSLALDDEFHPKMQMEDKNMEKMRTLALQVSEDLFQKNKDYLHCNNMSQKEFVVELTEKEIERDLTERESQREAQENAEEQTEDEQTEQEETAPADDFEGVSGEDEDMFPVMQM